MKDSIGDYDKKRALALFQIGMILYHEKSYSQSIKYLSLSLEDLEGKEKEKA